MSKKDRLKQRKTRRGGDEASRLARSIDVPAAQIRRGAFSIVDISNHSDADQRRMVRSGERRTIRRISMIDKLLSRGDLSREEASACEWYLDMHTRGYATVSVTARYGAVGGRGGGGYSHFAVDIEQEQHRQNYLYARAGIAEFLRPTFEAVVLYGRAPSSYELKVVKLAAIQLFGSVSHMIPLS